MYGPDDHRFDAEQQGRCSICGRTRSEGCAHCEECGCVMHPRIHYVVLTNEEWARCTPDNGYKIVGRDEGGYSLDGPDGDKVFFDDDEKCGCRVIEELVCANPACDNYDQ